MSIKKYFGPLSKDNPVLVQILGVCSSLAVTAQLKPAFVMALSVTIVTAFSNLTISAMRNLIPPRIRIIVQLVVIATLVILVDQVLQAFFYDVSKMLSVFVGLIITNCIIMGRVEAYALSNPPGPSFLDGLFNGLGYGLVLVTLGTVREILGSGTLWKMQIIPASVYEHGYLNNGLMVLPPAALILVGVMIWIQRAKMN
ncbi:MAG TPA: NADH:ubiquinone reductase (Na(+)-transporting) subunit D [Bacteroidales bacterium]|jgi:Na+-transporting NADH:ubiquinone oxidoreductase subunit D|nr:NADH:ubiquinone reductase (Na(+)-transporting) subunit D [Bacteroidales bacterium]HPS71288.1 NADH:ubiquinone reductase (Na(+)-transporting) subunit D [Bacteroidales bacterium]